MKSKTIVFAFLLIALIGCSTAQVFFMDISPILSEKTPEIDKTREAKLLTAFFGLDNNLNLKALRISKKAYKKDGMPLVFSQEIVPNSIQATDFEITTRDGKTHFPEDMSLLPANEAFELRTILLIGEYGSHPDNPPMTVKIVGDLMTRSGQNYKGQQIDVIQLPEGPILSYAEYFTFTDDYPYNSNERGGDCPREETKMVVTVVWAGGVRAINGKELGVNELKNHKVYLVNGNDTTIINPFKLADLGDNDNNIDLCLNQSGIPILVKVDANVAIDPNDDKNPETMIEVLSRW